MSRSTARPASKRRRAPARKAPSNVSKRPAPGGSRAAAKTTPAPLSRKEQGEQTRRAILEAAVELYAETGFRGTGLIAVGERAGVHHATVLYHFGSSRELLLAVLEERDRRFLDVSLELGRDGGLGVFTHLPMTARFNLSNPVWAKLFTVLQVENLDESAEAHEYFLERRKVAHALLVQALRSAKERGEIRTDVDETRTADAILAFAAGAQVQYLLDPKNVDLVGMYERFRDMLLDDLTRGLRPR